MSKAKRLLSLILCVALLGGIITAAQAEQITVGILLTGMLPEADGTLRPVTLDGSFRVYQNGQECGIIAAGRDTLTLSSLDRIRIEPLANTFMPEWDLTAAVQTVDPVSSGTQIIPVTLSLRQEGAGAQTAAGDAAPDPDESDPETAAASGEPAQAARSGGLVPTPTLPPFAGIAESATPEPVPAGAPAGTGSLRVNVFSDRNGDGYCDTNDKGVAKITVYLLNEAEETLAAAVTGKDGIAVFSNLAAGSYRTRVNLPEDWSFSAYMGENNLSYSAYGLTTESSRTSGAVTVAEGAEAQQGIGLRSGFSMSGFCWLDETVDGLYKKGETMIPGVRVQLTHTTEDLVYTTESGEDGTWKITNLYPGTYTLTATGPAGLMLTRYTKERGKRSYLTSDNSRRQVSNGDNGLNDVNFGFNWPTQVTGRCYLDANYNGVYDEGELPLAGVKLSARFVWDDREASAAVSGEDGTYVLNNMRGNTYNIQVMLPSDSYTFTKLAASLPLGNRLAPRAGHRDQTLRNQVLKDAEIVRMDIGAIIPSTVSGTVYFDDNFSAGRDGKERVSVGFKVQIRDAAGKIAASGKTDASGRYTLEGLAPGEYTLDVTAAAGYAFTRRGEGNVILNRTAGQGYSEPFRVELGQAVGGKDIGMIRPGTVKGTVFADRNDNGIRDTGEDGLTGVTVRLVSEEEGEAFRAEIGADGRFLFDAVMPGRYYVEYLLPENAVFAKTAENGNEIAAEGTTARTEAFDFVTGEVRQAPLCGALTLGRIQGTAYQDHDGDGRRTAEESLAGMTVRLIPTRSDLQEMTVVTDADGAFLLDNLHPDLYSLQVVCPEGYVLSRTDYMTLPLKAGEKEQTAELNVPMGAQWTDQEAGAVMPAAIRGQLWLDENDNGLFDEGERTPAGYTFQVIDEATGKVFDSPVTDEQGCFAAAGMIPGSFAVSLPMDDRMLSAKAGDSVFREENGALVITGIQLKENETRDHLLAGMVRYTTVSGHAWIDRGGSVEDLAGLQVTMRDAEGRVTATAVTDSWGRYSLEKLMPGAFLLEVTAPEGCVIIEQGDPRLNGDQISVIDHPTNREGHTQTLELYMDQDLDRMDIGCVLPGRLGDYCWVDLNGDGLQAGDEPGIPNVRIVLLRDGVAVAETQTDQYGFYRFVDLYPASYVLRVDVPAEVKPTRRRSDLPMISSVLEESEVPVALSVPVTVESNRAQYDADLGFVCRKEGVLPAGAGQGATQVWTPKY